MNQHLLILPTLAIAAMLSACGSNTAGPRTPTPPAPSATVAVLTTIAATTVIQSGGTAVASPASTSVPDLTPPPPPTLRPENTTPHASLPDVTLADNGSTVRLRVGQSFLLNLGSDGWNVTVADQAVISRVVNITVIRGAQGVYAVHAPGRTTLDAVGPSPCPNAVPACGAPVRVFRVTIVVT